MWILHHLYGATIWVCCRWLLCGGSSKSKHLQNHSLMVLSAVYLLVIAHLINHVNIHNWCEHPQLIFCVCVRAHKEIKNIRLKDNTQEINWSQVGKWLVIIIYHLTNPWHFAWYRMGKFTNNNYSFRIICSIKKSCKLQ